MLFNSVEYLLFFCIVLLLSWLLVGLPRLRIWVMLLASYYFYYSNNSWQIILILFSTQLDFMLGLLISHSNNPRKRKLWLGFSVLSNLGLLFYFKYYNFFAESTAMLASLIGIRLNWVDLNIILPVGISFYTFQSLAYTIDVYRGILPVERSWYRFAFFIAYFPQLIAGPIVRAEEFLPQIDRTPRLDSMAFSESIRRIFLGLFKKIILADLLATHADLAFNSPHEIDSIRSWIGVLAFAWQIYFDFSGYTDIAIGSARLMGYTLPENFNAPYAVRSITAFWQSWHMTLSRCLRDYLYIFALGGNRMPTRTGVYRNLLLTMLLAGLWHGAAWHFVLWGGLHGLLLVLERATGKNTPNIHPHASWQDGWHRLGMFILIMLLWIPFRSDNLELMIVLLKKMFLWDAPPNITLNMVFVVILAMVAWLTQWLTRSADWQRWWSRLPLTLQAALCALTFTGIMVFNSTEPEPFIYFRF
ncbi:MAG: MBOAT family protein [Magnetococcales bacterium]|nr:MBOAT family protein [Magnetococcales bacterium]